MSTEDRCENCKRNWAFALYQLTTAAYSFWVTNDRHEREQIWVREKTLTKKLCADCGFNIVNLRKVSRGEFHELRRTPSGDQLVQGETIFQRQVYTKCVLIMMLHNTETIEHAKKLSREAMLLKIEEGKHNYEQMLHAMRSKLGASEPNRRDERPVRELSRGGANRRGVNLLGGNEPQSIEKSSSEEQVVLSQPAARTGPLPRRRGP